MSHLGRAGETVSHSTSTGRVLLQKLHGVLFCFTAMKDNRKLQFFSKLQLGGKSSLLDLFLCIHVVVIEASFSDSNNFCTIGKATNLLCYSIIVLTGIMWVDAESSVDLLMICCCLSHKVD